MAFVGGIDESVERFGGGLPGGEHADVVNDHELGARVILARTLLVEPSTAARPIAVARDSRVNHETRMPASMTRLSI
ncbi:hypothetical protein GCM10010977_21310 [Citricoccus zhacaiensis]|uniref:Uncharacterized protein n=1 Tax=Citricoccus zhacaiensis TaxID=489142 RepID=A0ABQ2M3I3_9MICC|nr:hypothetical protein [Citricoccus zhacaiensis]GGO46426.1 hypothetical protein GCM10010977_21310 [Citricoccus zhacaiensis]